MNRDTRDDFQLLVRHLEAYSIAELAGDPHYQKSLRQTHSKYLAILTFLAEIRGLPSGYLPANDIPTADQQTYLNECASDLGQALFNWCNGGYKSCRVMLRSSIETFVKGICLDEKPQILTEKRLHEVFSQAASSSAFKNTPNDTIFQQMHAHYVILCGDVHTSAAANMANISSLNYFPSFETGKANDAASSFLFITNRINTLLCLIFNKAFHRMHHRNKKIILEAVIERYKPTIQNIL